MAVADYIGTGKPHNTRQKLQYCSHVLGNGVQVLESVVSKRRTYWAECCMEFVVVLGVILYLPGIEPPPYTSWFAPYHF